MFRKTMRRFKPVAFTLGLALMSGGAQAQTTFNESYVFPQIPENIVAQFNSSTAPTGGDPTFNAPLISLNDDPLNSILPATQLISGIGQSQTLYRVKNFTVTMPATYNITLKGTLTNSATVEGVLYRSNFDPAHPLSNIVQLIPGSTGTPRVVTVNLDAGNYILVVTGTNNGAAGTFTATLTPAYTPFFSVTGTTVPAGSSPQFNRPTPNGNLPPVTLNFGANYAYSADPFTVPTDGLYQIYSDETSPNLYQGELSLYQGSFDPANPLNNCLQVSGNSTLFGSPKGSSKLIVNLKAGVQYILVTSNFQNGVGIEDDYVNTVKPLTVVPLDTWSGTTVGAPTFNRPNQPSTNGTLTPTAPPSGVNVAYDAHTFTSPVSGKITVTSTCVAPASWNNYLVVYGGTFDPSHPLANVLYAADGGYNNVITSYTVTGQGYFNSVVSISFNATAGQLYTFVTTGNTTTSVGSYTGSVTQDQDPNSGTAVATLSGALTPGTPTTPYYQKPYQAYPTTKAPSQVSASATPYSVDQFTIATDGDYYIVDATTVPTSWGLYFILYKNGFDATQPLSGIYQDPVNSVYSILGSDNSKAALAVHLTAGTYYAVTSGFGSLAYGDYKLTVQKTISSPTPLVYTDTLNAGTGNRFTRPNAGTVAPLTLSTATNDFYDAKTFTVPTTAAYNMDVIANPSGTDIYGKWNDFVVLYNGAFDPNNPLTNAIAANDSINLFGTDAGLRNVTLTAGTTYTLVATGSSYNQFGSYQATVYTGGGQYPPLIPDNTPAGLAAVNNVTDTFTVQGLNSVTIKNLYHPHAGDLLATLSHGGVTIELTDRVGRTTSGSTGSSALFFGDYTFAPGGSDLSAAATGTPSGGIDATQNYAPYLNGTAYQSSNLTGDFTAFNGMSVSGPWTLKISDNNAGSIGYFGGFTFNVIAATGVLTIHAALEGVPDLTMVSANSPLGTFHVSLRAPGDLTEKYGYDAALDPATSTLTIPNAITGTYDVWIKGSKNLAVLAPNVTISTTGTTIASSGSPLVLPAGDSNNDNFVDSSDFGALIGAFNTDSSVSGGGYDPTVDFNFDGVVDSSDFGLLIGNFNNAGAN